MNFFDEQHFIHQLSIDCVIFGYKNKELKVLVPKLDLKAHFWALPGGFIKQDEGIDEAAGRILLERTGLKDIYLEQFRVFGQPERMNNMVFDEDYLVEKGILDLEGINWLNKRFVSIGYYALVDIDKVNPQKTAFDESIDWHSIENLPQLIIDHNIIVGYALQTLRQTLDQKLLGLNLLPEIFTMKELQELYEAIYDKPFARNNFQKKILDLNVLERLEKKFTGAANKAPYLYRFVR